MNKLKLVSSRTNHKYILKVWWSYIYCKHLCLWRVHTVTSGSTWSRVASGENLAIKIPLQRQIQKYPNGNVSPGSFYIYMLISTFIHISIPIIIWTVPMILESLSPSLCFYPILILLSPSLSPLILFVNLTGIWPHFIILNLVTMVLHVLQCVMNMNKLYRVRVYRH